MKTPSKDIIEKYFSLTKNNMYANTIIDFYIKDINFDIKKYVRQTVLDMIAQIQRWDLMVNRMIVHPENMKILKSYLKDNIDETCMYYDNGSKIFRATYLFGLIIEPYENIEKNILLAVGEEDNYEDMMKKYEWKEDDGKNIAVGILDIEMINRLEKIICFS